MVKHELGSSAYRHRVAECADAVAVIRDKIPRVESLRDVSSEMLSGFQAVMKPVPMRRARHVVSENERVEAFVAASRAGELKRMGALLAAAHRSLQKDYEVSCEELDFLVDAALGLPGVYGARMTGGGFGGCTVNMVRPDAVLGFQATISEAYESRFGLTPDIYPCRPSAGAGEVTASAGVSSTHNA
jgi:galactokinase